MIGAPVWNAIFVYTGLKVLQGGVCILLRINVITSIPFNKKYSNFRLVYSNLFKAIYGFPSIYTPLAKYPLKCLVICTTCHCNFTSIERQVKSCESWIVEPTVSYNCYRRSSSPSSPPCLILPLPSSSLLSISHSLLD